MRNGQRAYKIQVADDSGEMKEQPGYHDLGVCLDIVLAYVPTLTSRWPIGKFQFQEFKWSRDQKDYVATGGCFPA